MVFMDYRDYMKQKLPCLEEQYPTFLYAMPMSPTRVFFEVCPFSISALCLILLIIIMSKYLAKLFFQETCLASKEAMPFDLLKKKLLSRLKTMGIQIIKAYEEVNFSGQAMMLVCFIDG